MLNLGKLPASVEQQRMTHKENIEKQSATSAPLEARSERQVQGALTPKEIFERHGMCVITEVVNEEECKKLSKHMFDLFEQGKLSKDPQCPLSDSIYGDPIWDKMLEDFAKPIGEYIGYELLPTYTYARIYRKGEELKIHKDRPSCEISATMTIDFADYPIWPIHMGSERNVIIDRGDMIVYKGCELDHWRDPFKGEWQVQVFFHYVDANGPHKDLHKDGRNNLGEKKENPAERPEPDIFKDLRGYANQQLMTFGNLHHNGFTVLNSHDYDVPGYMGIEPDETNHDFTLTPEDCKLLIDEIVNKQYAVDAGVGSNMTGSSVTKEIRSCKIYAIPKDERFIHIYNKIISSVSIANKFYYDFELTGFLGELQLLEYKHDENSSVPDHYNWHADCGPGESATRKLSVVVQLTDPSEYEGCELVINNNGMELEASKKQGTINMFPSYSIHTVKPITKGTRHCIVVWIHGNKRFR